MGAKILKCTPSFNLVLDYSKPFLNIFLNSCHNSAVLDFYKFANLNFNECLSVLKFLNMGLYARKHFKTYLLFQMAFK